jgi:hypothetical protein
VVEATAPAAVPVQADSAAPVEPAAPAAAAAAAAAPTAEDEDEDDSAEPEGEACSDDEEEGTDRRAVCRHVGRQRPMAPFQRASLRFVSTS